MARECPPIRIEERFTAKSVKKLGEGHFLVDVGKNGAGFVELVLHGTTKENRGNWISMYPAEMINETDNGVDQRSCTQSWSEKFDCVIRDSIEWQDLERSVGSILLLSRFSVCGGRRLPR